jgi:tRNA(adenine34) deaminase
MVTIGGRVPDDGPNMELAINLAKLALWEGRAGYGCLIIDAAGRYLGAGRGSETPTDCTCHSEVVAIRESMARAGGLLHGATLYSTFEPCMFCCGAINHAKVSRVVWGAGRDDLPHLYRQRYFSAGDLLHDTSDPPLYRAGVLRAECMRVTAGMPRPRAIPEPIDEFPMVLF